MLDIIIGEKLNSSIKSTYEAMISFDEDKLIEIIKSQESADYLDLNTAMCDDELGVMIKIIDLIIDNTDCGISIDSPNADIISKAADYINSKKRKFILNSVTMTERIDKLIPAAVKYDCKIIAMPIQAFGISADINERIANTEILLNKFHSHGIGNDKIIIDAVAESLIANHCSADITVKTVRRLKEIYPDIKIICGISNISYGLPGRPYINAAFLSSLILNGLDCAIIDITASENKTAIQISNMFNGDDEYLIDYITYIKREG